MGKAKKVDEYQVEFAFRAHIAQFEALRDDISLATSSQNNLINYSIAAIGGLIVLFTIEDQNGDPIIISQAYLLPIISLVMSMITWASLEAELRIHDYLRFIEKVLGPRVQKLVGTGDLPDELTVFKMEVVEISRSQKVRTILRGILVSGKFLVSYIPVVVISIIFIASFPDWYQSILFWCSAVVALIVPVVLIAQSAFVSKYYWEND